MLNILGKILELIVVTKIAWALEEYKILSNIYLGGQKRISIDYAIQLILDRIQTIWDHGRKVSIFLLNISDVFDNVSHERLIWNIYISRLGQFAGWIRLFLTGRTMQLFFTGFISDLIDTATGILQGLFLSPILSLIYNTPLIRALAVRKPSGGETEVFGWVDDAAVIAVLQLYIDNTAVLQEALTKIDRWAAIYTSKFAPDKFELIHFTNSRDSDSM